MYTLGDICLQKSRCTVWQQGRHTGTYAQAKAVVSSSLTKMLRTYSSPNVATALRPRIQDSAGSRTPQHSQQHLSSLAKPMSALCGSPEHSFRAAHHMPTANICTNRWACMISTCATDLHDIQPASNFMHCWRKAPQNRTRIEDTPLILQPGNHWTSHQPTARYISHQCSRNVRLHCEAFAAHYLLSVCAQHT